ncbi:MAG: LysR substrate-binding domain-containing protein [Pseudomonadota bacterium]
MMCTTHPPGHYLVPISSRPKRLELRLKLRKTDFMDDWIPSLNALRAFEVVSRHLSYRGAAEELRVTPGAVKHLVAKLEATLDLKLIERRGHSLGLTPVGEAARNDAALGMRHLSQSVQTMRQFRLNKRLIVSVEASLATTWLAPRLGSFWATHPDIDVLVDASQKINDLKRNDVDVAVRYGVPRDEDLVAKRLFEDLVFPACSPAFAKGPARLETLDQLRDVPLIHWDTSHMHWAHATRRWFSWDAWLRHVGIEGVDTSRGKRFSDYGLAVQAAASGQGVILAGWPTLSDSLDAGLLVCPFADSTVETDIGFDVVTTIEATKRPEVCAFVDWLIETARAASPMR